MPRILRAQNSCGGLDVERVTNLYRIIDQERAKRNWTWENIDVNEHAFQMVVHGRAQGEQITRVQIEDFFTTVEKRLLN